MAKKPGKVSKETAMRRFATTRTDERNDRMVMKPTPELLEMVKRGDKIARAEAARRGWRHDGWENVVTGAGVRGFDSRMAGRLQWSGIMSETEAEQIYSSDELARRLVELPPRECLKNWIKFTGMDQFVPAIEEEVDRLKVRERFYEAACWGRLYGGSAIFLATGEDPDDFKYPLDPARFDRIESLVLFSRYELLVRSTDLETDINNPNYGQPKYYWLTPRKGNVSTLFSVRIHHTRLIRFGGKALPLRLKVFNRYWDDSIYTGVIETLRDYGFSHASIASVLQKFRVAIYKMKDLADQLSSDDGNEVKDRLRKLNAVESVFGTYFLDQDEEMDFHSDTFSGVKDMLQALKEALQAKTDIPNTVLFNESPSAGGGGMGQTGDTGLTNWYSYLEGEQKNYYTSKIDQLLIAMLQGPKGPTGGQEPEDWDWEFNKIQTMDDNQQADLEGKQLENSAKRQSLGVDDVYDTMERHNPEKLAAINATDADRMKATVISLVQAEQDRLGDPANMQLPSIPDDLDPLVRERSKTIVPPNPKGAPGQLGKKNVAPKAPKK